MTVQDTVKWDAETLMEHIIMCESRHMQMSRLVEHQLKYPDMTIRDFYAMASDELKDEEEEEEHIDLSLEENAEWDNFEVHEEEEENV